MSVVYRGHDPRLTGWGFFLLQITLQGGQFIKRTKTEKVTAVTAETRW